MPGVSTWGATEVPRPGRGLQSLARRFAIAMVAVLVMTASGIGYAHWYKDSAWKKRRVVDLEVRSVGRGEPANFLIIGSDTREFVASDLERQQFGDPDEQTGQRSDTIMVAHIDPDGESILVSFPRDLWVDIPGHGEDKINSAFSQGGPQLTIDTIEQNFDVPIHHYLEVNFATFRDIVGAIGSVDLFFPTAARDAVTGLEIDEPGCHALEEDQALAYVRSRYYEYLDADGDWKQDPTADIGRIRRQQYFIRSLLNEAVEQGARNLLTAKRLVDRTVPKLRTDRDLEIDDVYALMNSFRDTDAAGVEMTMIPADLDRSPDGESILVLRNEDARPILETLRNFEANGDADPVELPDVDPATVAVAVQNGSGVQGAARETSDALVAFGFENAGAANADRSDYETTEIHHRPGARDAGRLVQAYLVAGGELIESDDTGAADVVVVLGRDFAGVEAPPGATAPTSAPTGSTEPPSTAAANPGSTPGVTMPPTEAFRPLVGCG